MVTYSNAGLVACIVAFIVTGCDCSKSASPAATPLAGAPPSVAACPLAVEGARMAVADAEGGATVTVTTTGERVDELRHRLRDAASLYGVGAHKGLGHHGGHLGHQRHGLQLTRLPPLTAEAEDVDGGGRLRLVAVVPSHVDALRERVREEVERVSAGPCD